MSTWLLPTEELETLVSSGSIVRTKAIQAGIVLPTCGFLAKPSPRFVIYWTIQYAHKHKHLKKIFPEYNIFLTNFSWSASAKCIGIFNRI